MCFIFWLLWCPLWDLECELDDLELDTDNDLDLERIEDFL